MNKQKLAQMVLQKMNEKKAKQEANRPHYQVLQMLVLFNIEQYDTLQKDISMLEKDVAYQEQLAQQLEKHLQELDNTGKKNYPRIIIKPQFIASQQIPILIKEFYRKSSNSFLKNDIIRKRTYEQSLKKQQSINKMFQQIATLEEQVRSAIATHVEIDREKRVKVLKQDLRLRSIKDQQKRLSELIEKQHKQHQKLINEYELKKLNLNNRIAYSQKMAQQIVDQTGLIQSTYNPITYRQFLKRMFLIRAKNEVMRKNLLEAVVKIETLTNTTQKHQKLLVQTQSFLLYGRTFDSPSRNKGKRQIQRERQLSQGKDQYQQKQKQQFQRRKNSEGTAKDTPHRRFSSTLRTARSVTNINFTNAADRNLDKSLATLSTAAKTISKKLNY